MFSAILSRFRLEVLHCFFRLGIAKDGFLLIELEAVSVACLPHQFPQEAASDPLSEAFLRSSPQLDFPIMFAPSWGPIIGFVIQMASFPSCLQTQNDALLEALGMLQHDCHFRSLLVAQLLETFN